MQIMHPLRDKMIDITLSVLPFDQMQPLTVLDLGIGTGVFSQRLLARYPKSRIVGVDGAAAMLELAKSRLGGLADRVDWVVSEFQNLSPNTLKPETYDAVISSYALHHLSRLEKLVLLKSVVQALKPGGWLMNADLVVAGFQPVEARIQELRVAGVTNRAPQSDRRFRSAASTRQFLDELEEADNDQPQTMEVDLSIIREAGIEAEVLWKEFREVIIGGPKR